MTTMLKTEKKVRAYTNFRWADDVRLPPRLAEPLGRLVAENQGIAPDEVLELATPEDSELHDLIPSRLWNDEEAAREHRLEVIRHAIRNVTYDIVSVPTDEAVKFRGGVVESAVVNSPLVIPNDQRDSYRVVGKGFPVCVHVGDRDGKVYIPAHEAVKNEDQREEMIKEAIGYLQGWQRRFQTLKNIRKLKPIFSAIEAIKT